MGKNKKTYEERHDEILIIKNKLSELGLSEEFEPIKEFYNECDRYIKSGDSWSGSIKLSGLKRIIEVRLTTSKDLNCDIVLKYNKDI